MLRLYKMKHDFDIAKLLKAVVVDVVIIVISSTTFAIDLDYVNASRGQLGSLFLIYFRISFP